MAKVIGPLFSQEARGQFGKSLVFTRRRGQNIVRGYVVPSNPQTVKQVANRIAFAAAGIITRRVSQGRWTHANNAQTFVQFWTGRVDVGEVWNSAMVSAMLGVGLLNYNAKLVIYEALSQSDRTKWKTEAERAGVGLQNYVRGTTTVDAGFMLFLAERTNSEAGYQTLATDSTPVVIAFAPQA